MVNPKSRLARRPARSHTPRVPSGWAVTSSSPSGDGAASPASAGSGSTRAPYAWFVAFAEDPKVAVAVFVQDAGVDGSEVSGGRYAAPIAQAVIEAVR